MLDRATPHITYWPTLRTANYEQITEGDQLVAQGQEKQEPQVRSPSCKRICKPDAVGRVETRET
jgi:hypothetical protein